MYTYMYIHFECVLYTVHCILNSRSNFKKNQTGKNVLEKLYGPIKKK